MVYVPENTGSSKVMTLKIRTFAAKVSFFPQTGLVKKSGQSLFPTTGPVQKITTFLRVFRNSLYVCACFEIAFVQKKSVLSPKSMSEFF